MRTKKPVNKVVVAGFSLAVFYGVVLTLLVGQLAYIATSLNDLVIAQANTGLAVVRVGDELQQIREEIQGTTPVRSSMRRMVEEEF